VGKLTCASLVEEDNLPAIDPQTCVPWPPDSPSPVSANGQYWTILRWLGFEYTVPSCQNNRKM
jgi:hypothetical protein